MKTISKIVPTLLSASLLITPCCVSEAMHDYLMGDTDTDGVVSIIDATLIQQRIAEFALSSTIDASAADVDSDGELTIMDATAIQLWLAELNTCCPIGEWFSHSCEEKVSEPVSTSDGKSVTIVDAPFDVSSVPVSVSIDNVTKSKANLVLKPQANINPYDITVVVNNGRYINRIDYSNPVFKESYLTAEKTSILHGYDCAVVDENGNETAYVYAHYKGNLKYPYQITVYCFNQAHHSFPIDIYYKGQLIRSTTVSVNTASGPDEIERTRAKVREIESKCWTSSMTDKEKLQAFAQYIKSNYSYAQIMCVDGAVYTAWAARDLGLNSMLLYPGGERNQQCERHIVTYNLYQSTAVPGGHCACLVEYDDGVMRYDVQGGTCIIQPYQFPEG